MNTKWSTIFLIAMLVLNLVFVLSFRVIFVQASNGAEGLTLNYRLLTEETMVWIMGEVINDASATCGNISVKASFFDANQEILEEKSTTVWLQIILPGRRAPFVIGFEQTDVEGYEDYTVEITNYEISAAKPTSLSFENASLKSIDLFGTEISGTVRNNGAENATNVIVIAMFYDDIGYLAAESHAIAELQGRRLPPGETVDFVIDCRFVTNATSFRKYILTAESKNYAIKAEQIRDFPLDQDSIPDYVILGVVIVVAVIIAVVFVARSSRKKKSRRKTSSPGR